MHSRLERRGPRRGIHGCAPVLGALERLPVDEQGDRVLRLWHAIVRLAGRDARRGACNDARRHRVALHDPAVDIDMVRGEVVAIAVDR